MGPGRPRPLRREPRLGVPDGQRRREPQAVRRAVRAVGPYHRPRTELGGKGARAAPGRYDESLDWEYQTANVVENLKRFAGLCEPSGLIIVLEPLNPKDPPGLSLHKMSQ